MPPSPAASPAAPPEPTPMDNLLAVAELELELQSSALPAHYSFRSEEEQVASDVMSFELGEPKVPDEIFFDRKSAPSHVVEEDAFHGELVAHKELFDSINEAHYLPELGGPHDEALLESLVEKGCEDNQILGQALDKLAHLVTESGEYVEEEDDILLGGAPVADIIDRLESLESPARSSMTAAQGLLHLHHIGDHLPTRDLAQEPVENFQQFAPETTPDCPLETLASAQEMTKTTDVTHLKYEQDADTRLQSDSEPANVLYTDPVPDLTETYDGTDFESSAPATQRSPEQAELAITQPLPLLEDVKVSIVNEEIPQEVESNREITDTQEKQDTTEDLKPKVEELAKVNDNPEGPKDLSIMYIDDDREPRDLTVHRRMTTPLPSPRRIEIPRAPSRESDAMQSPQPSGIPAISSPEVFQAPPTKNKTQSILDAMFTSSSPKMYLTSEVSITKQQCEPLNLGKHRKSASPTVSSCSEEKSNKIFGEPLEKRQKRNSMDELYQITRLLAEKKKKDEKTASKKTDQEFQSMTPLKQFQNLKANKNFNIPDPLLIPKDRFTAIKNAPGKEIPALLVERPELRYFDDLDDDRDRDIFVISVKEFEDILVASEYAHRRVAAKIDQMAESTERVSDTPTTPVQTELHTTKPNSQPKPIPSMGALAEDIDAATSATLGPMLWAQYAQQQMEAVAVCSQNTEFLKALSASGYGGANYADISQMLLNHPSRLMNPAGFPMMPHMDYERMQLILWQEMMLQKAQTQRRKSTSETQMKEATPKHDFQSPYVHSTNKNYQSRSHSSARTSPITNNYSSQRAAMGQHPFLQGMYPGMGAGVRPSAPTVPMGGLNVPYFNPSAMSSQRSPRTHHKSPTPPSPSPSYYANNNYLAGLKASEAAAAAAQRAQHSPAESTRPRITVKKVDDLRRRRDDAEVGSTTPLGEAPLLPPDPSVPLWHPLFGNQKNYPAPWSWTTVTATGD